VILAEIWEFFQNSTVQWVIGILLAIALCLIPLRNKSATLRKVWYSISNKEFKVNIDAEMKFEGKEFYEDCSFVRESIVAELAEHGIKIFAIEHRAMKKDCVNIGAKMQCQMMTYGRW